MLDLLDILAVREAVERQKPLRRGICELFMADCSRDEICQRLGLSRFTLRRHMIMIRESFCEMGFEEWLLPRRAARRARPHVVRDRRPVAILGVAWRRI